MTSALAILLTSILVASACAVLGSFLVLRRMAMMTDAISHAILPGIVVGYFIANGADVLLGFLGATVAALITVTLVEALEKTRRVDGGAAIGIVFPAMFALGTILITRFFADVHLDTDAVLYGNIEFVSFDPLTVGGRNLGPQSLWVMGVLLVINLIFILLFYKELKLTTFDPQLAAVTGFSPVIVHYALMVVLSITTVGACSVVGAILVIALVIVPAATAYLLTDRLAVMVGLSVYVGVVAAAAGYSVAVAIDASVSGMIVTMTGVCFALALVFAPSHGLVARFVRRRRNRQRFALQMLLVHLWTHEQAGQESETHLSRIHTLLRWDTRSTARIVDQALRRGMVTVSDDRLTLTPRGHEQATQAVGG